MGGSTVFQKTGNFEQTLQTFKCEELSIQWTSQNLTRLLAQLITPLMISWGNQNGLFNFGVFSKFLSSFFSQLKAWQIIRIWQNLLNKILFSLITIWPHILIIKIVERVSQNASTFHVQKKGCSTKLNMSFNFPQHVKQIMLVKGKKKNLTEQLLMTMLSVRVFYTYKVFTWVIG